MKIFSSKKRAAAIGAVTAATLLTGTVAFAYWTNTGGGSGTAKAAPGIPFTITASVPDGIAPGLTRTVSFRVNNTAEYAQRLAAIQLASVSVDSDHASCVVTDFTMPEVTVEKEIPGGANNLLLTETGTLTMANTSVPQDDCKGATLTLNLTTS